MHRRWVKVAVAAVALIVVILVVIPFFVKADQFRPMLEDQLSSALGRKVVLTHLGFSVFSGSLVAENISIADDPAFSTAPFLKAKSLAIGVETGQLLFHRKVNITKLTVDTPAIQLIQNQAGIWNFSSLGGATPTAAPQAASAAPVEEQPKANPAPHKPGAKTAPHKPSTKPEPQKPSVVPAPQPPAAAATPQQPSTIPDFTVGELRIKNGSATVSSLPATAKPFVYSGINLAVQQLSFARSFPYQLSASLPGGGSLELNGTAGPLAQSNAAKTPFQATLQLKHFDPVAAGVIEKGKGISMVLDIKTQMASDGVNLRSDGKIQAENLQLARNGSPAPKPVDIDYKVSHNLDTRLGKVSSISVRAGNVAASVSGTYRITVQETELDLHLSAPNLPIDQMEQLLPAVGITLPSGSALRGGTLNASLAITGPATEPTIEGPVEIDNSNLAGFDLGSKISGINPFGGTGKGTAIQTLKAKVKSSPRSTDLTDIYADLPQVGTASGNGSVSASDALDFHLVAKFNSSTGVGAIASTAVNSLGGIFGKVAKVVKTKTANGIPLTITGTTKNPSIKADMRAML